MGSGFMCARCRCAECRREWDASGGDPRGRAGILRRACRRHKRAHPRVWERYFAEEYADAVTALLQGETLHTFSRMMGLRPPDTTGLKLGNRKW